MEHLHNFLRLESLQDCVGVMHSRASEHLEKHWVPYNEVKVQPLSKDFTLSNDVHLLVSSNEDLAREVAEPFYTLAERVLSVPVNLPGTSYNQALKASKIVKGKLMDLMRSKREEILSAKENNVDIEIVGKELLSKLLIASYEEDFNSIDDEEIAGLIIGLQFAGFHTTSTLITFIIDYLAQYPDVYAKVLQEQLEIAQSKRKGELLNWKDIQSMKYTWNVACETMRLKPPAVGGFREAISDISYAGYTVPKGAKVRLLLGLKKKLTVITK
ncbi:beta-amyrin 28-oxidase-like [Chenopodium quinoa]|uniref:beta-amyrin 28-oxidase-like n=1 Tax=Chenopodium quinoa TaxID=63459 RepID=UPI000B78AAC7|nr:beta-amyrin 28-oxidase-like [Chenopodium quinoa]